MGQKIVATPRVFDALCDAGVLKVAGRESWGAIYGHPVDEIDEYRGLIICELIEGEEVRIEK